MQYSQTSYWKKLPFWTRFSFIFANDCYYNGITLLVLRFLSLLQALIIVFSNTITTKSYSYDIFQSFFIQLQKLTDLNHYADNQNLVSSLLIILGIIILYFLVMLFIIVKSAFLAQKQLKMSHFHQFSSALISVHAEIIFYPITYTLVAITNEIGDNQSLSFPLPKEAVLTIAIVLLCFNALITFFKIAFCYCRINSKNLISRKSSLHLIGLSLLKLILVILHAPSVTGLMTQELTINKIISIVFSFMITLGILSYYHIFLPEYDFRLIKMYIIFASVLFALSAGQLGDLIIGKENIVIECAILIKPIWVKLNFNIFNARMQKLKYHSENIKNINYCVQLESMYKYLESNWELRLHDHKFPVSSLKANWLIENKFKNDRIYSDLNQLNHGIEDKSKTYMKMYLENILRQNSSNSLAMLTYAQLIIEPFHMYAKVYDLCQNVSKNRFNIPDQISLYSLLCILQSSLQTGPDFKEENGLSLQAIENSLLAEDQLEKFQARLANFSEKSISFWKILKSERPDIFSLYTNAEGLEKEKLHMEADWKVFESKFCSHIPTALLLYSIFKSEFLNLPHEGSLLMDRYNLFVKNKGLFSEKFKHNIEEYGSISVSGERKTMGSILACSDMISKIFGFSKETLLNRNVNILMPRFFKERHDQFLLNYYETGQSHRLRKESKLYGKDKDDHVFSISIILTIQPSLDNGVVYTGLVKRIKDQSEYILFREDGIIEEISTELERVFCIKPYQGVSIAEICLNYNKKTYKDIKSGYSEYTESQTYSEGGIRKENLRNLQMLTFQQYSDLGRTFSYKSELNSFIYDNKVLNVMILKPLGPILRKRGQSKPVVSPKIDIEKSFDLNLTRGLSEANEHDSSVLKNESNSAFRQLTSFRNFDNMTERRLIGEENSVKINDPFNEEGDSDSVNEQFEDERERKDALRSFGRKASSVTSVSKSSVIDNFQKLYEKHHPDKFRNFVILAFIVLFTASLVVAGVQYVVFQESLVEINFSMSSIRQSYDGLAALVWIWRYSVIWNTRAKGFVTTSVAELTRYKLVISSNRELMKAANTQLGSTISKQAGAYRDLFLKRNIRLIYTILVNHLQLDESNTFEVANLFIGKLMRFDMTPIPSLTNVSNIASPDLEYIKINTGNDMLENSENLIQTVETSFREELSNKQFLIRFIFCFNMVIPIFLMLIIALNFQVRKQKLRRLTKAMLVIHPKDIDNIIHKYSNFKRLLAKKGQDLAQELHICYLQRNIEIEGKFANFKSTQREFTTRGISILKVKQGLVLFVMLICFTMVYSIGYWSSKDNLEGLVETNNQIILVSKAKHNSNMALAIPLYLIESGINVTVRNQPIAGQIITSANNIVSNKELFDAFTDKTGHFIDPRVENMFMGQPCAFAVNFPGSLIDQHCPKVTQNNSIGLFAVNADYQQDVLNRDHTLLADTGLANRIASLSPIISILHPKSNTLIAGYMYIAQIMVDKFNKQNSSLNESAITNLVIEMVFMCLFAILSTWFLIKKVMDDRILRMLLKFIPYQEISKNKFLQNAIKELYKDKPEILRFMK